jgi:hypothetical protein
MMHIRYTVRNDRGEILTCVVDGEKDLITQFEEILYIRPGNGISVTVRDEEVEVVDYYHASSMASFAVLSQEETVDPVSLRWARIEKPNE